MRKYASTAILLVMMLASEVHTFWGKDGRVQNWILTKYRPMTIEWNVKYAVGQLWFIAIGAAWLLYVKNKFNYTTVLTFWIWFILDTFMYFFNYKTEGYWKVYYWIVPIWVISYLWKGRHQQKVIKTIHPNL